MSQATAAYEDFNALPDKSKDDLHTINMHLEQLGNVLGEARKIANEVIEARKRASEIYFQSEDSCYREAGFTGPDDYYNQSGEKEKEIRQITNSVGGMGRLLYRRVLGKKRTELVELRRKYYRLTNMPDLPNTDFVDYDVSRLVDQSARAAKGKIMAVNEGRLDEIDRENDELETKLLQELEGVATKMHEDPKVLMQIILTVRKHDRAREVLNREIQLNRIMPAYPTTSADTELGKVGSEEKKLVESLSDFTGWQEFYRVAKAENLLPLEDLDRADEVVGVRAIEKYNKMNANTASLHESQILQFRSPRVRALALLKAHSRNFGNETSLAVAKFAAELDEDELSELRGSDVAGIYEAINLIREHPNDFDSFSIDNPQYDQFVDQLGNDQEFLDFLAGQLTGGKIVIGGDQGAYEWGIWNISESQLKQMLPDLANFVEGEVAPGSELDGQIRRAHVKNIFNENQIFSAQPNDYGDERPVLARVDQQNANPNRQYLYISPEVVANFVEKYGVSKDFIENKGRLIDNPVYAQVRQHFSSARLSLIEQADTPLALEAVKVGVYPTRTEEYVKVLTDPGRAAVGYELAKIIAGGNSWGDNKVLIDNLATLNSGATRVAEDFRSRIVDSYITYLNNYSRRPDETTVGKFAEIFGVSRAQMTQALTFLESRGSMPAQAFDSSHYLGLLPESKSGFIEVSVGLLEGIKSLSGNNLSFFQREDASKTVLEILAQNPDQLNNILSLQNHDFLNSRQNHGFIAESLARVLEIPPERRVAYLEIIDRIRTTPSQEIKKIESQLIQQIWTNDDPIEAFGRIESVFVKNNLPMVGKVFRVFEILHPTGFSLKANSSPELQRVAALPGGERRKQLVQNRIFYRDLLKCHVLSGNNSLREYLETMARGKKSSR